MASVQAFNSVMDEFLKELTETFPEEKKIKVYYNSFLTLKKTNPRKILEIFMSQASSKGSLITSRDEKLFSENDEIIPDVELSKIWNDNLDSETKDAIWQYLNTLYVLGTTINSIPSNLLSTIEGVAEQCASQMEGEAVTSGGAPDMGSLLAGMQNMIGNMMPPQQKETKERIKSSRKGSKK